MCGRTISTRKVISSEEPPRVSWEHFIDKRNRDDVELLIDYLQKKQDQVLVKYAKEEALWKNLDEITRTYLIARACDLVRYDEFVANLTFP
jgi:hypothetical protein